MTGRLLTVASVISLLLCAGTCALWVRSYRAVGPSEADSLDFTHAEPLYWVISNPGRLTLCRQVGKDWNSPTAKFQLLGIEYASSFVGASSLWNLLVPYWMLAVLTLLPPLAWLAAWCRHRVTRLRLRRGQCPGCGYDLRASTERCPECGKTLTRPVASQTRGVVFFVIVTLALSARSADASERAAGFEIKRNCILNRDGKPFIVKGVASPYGPFCGGGDDWDSGNTVDRDYDAIKALGCNFVRICVTYKVAHDDARRARLADVVDKARARGFVVEIANSYTSRDDNLARPVGGQPCWLAWLARRWKEDPYVWLLPMNEPNGSPPGDMKKLGDWNYWQREQNACIRAARDAGNTAPLVVNTPGWSWGVSKVPKFPLDDPLKRLVYGVHRYADENQTFDDRERTASDKAWASLADRLPIVVEEVGGQNGNYPAHLDWNRGFMNFCADWVNARHGCGVVAFNWYWCDDNSMTGDWRHNRNDGKLNEWGTIFHDEYIARVKPRD